ncbi:unnamed protein product [Clonostachys chloroleuca]|uniref:Uncharacterized protein n=1 Tax=Clonostachys chloroleuca TaxID=1926264 RepID=A0AA35Q5T9_9HYPO|nr:unnamed protein product [Clonostachys chloroleuca]
MASDPDTICLEECYELRIGGQDCIRFRYIPGFVELWDAKNRCWVPGLPTIDFKRLEESINRPKYDEIEFNILLGILYRLWNSLDARKNTELKKLKNTIHKQWKWVYQFMFE